MMRLSTFVSEQGKVEAPNHNFPADSEPAAAAKTEHRM